MYVYFEFGSTRSIISINVPIHCCSRRYHCRHLCRQGQRNGGAENNFDTFDIQIRSNTFEYAAATVRFSSLLFIEFFGQFSAKFG